MKSKKKPLEVLTKKDLILYVCVPVIGFLIGGFFVGYSAIKTSNAQIKAAKITKVEQIAYDFKETSNWNVKESRYYMPLKKGNYWTYNGTYTGYSMKYQKYFTKKAKVKFEILKEYKKDGMSLFVVSNSPIEIQNLISSKFDSMKKNDLNSAFALEFVDRKSISGLLLVANKLFYIPKTELKSVENYLKSPDKRINNEFPKTSLSYRDLVFEFPMFKGQRFGDLNSITRKDLSYFWYVNDVREINSLKGNTFEKVQVFDIIENTLPDQQMITFRPYLGILSFNSIHKGTKNDLQLELKKYKIE